MLNVEWANRELVHLIWVALAITGLIAWLETRGHTALDRVLSRVMQGRLAERLSPGQRRLRLLLIFGTQALTILALMRPQTPGGLESVSASRTAADIMVVLDVSKSMLAEDAAPNRLARAKAEIGSMVDRLDGHRIGLVAFAGRAAVLCPLTPDYGFFRMILRSADPSSVSRGGTRIGDAIRTAVRAFDPGPGSKIILLITDGEDHDSMPEDAAKRAREAGVRIISIGFGSEEGSEIVMTDPTTGARMAPLDHDGQRVISRLDGELLRKIALETEGAYVPAGVSTLDLESIVAEHIEPIVRVTEAQAHRRAPTEHYVWLVLGALLGLVAVVILSTPGGRS